MVWWGEERKGGGGGGVGSGGVRWTCWMGFCFMSEFT